MLKTKQLCPLSQRAKLFLFSGSRCSVADGGSCAYSEDDNFVSKRLERSNEGLLPHNASTTTSKTSEAAASSHDGITKQEVGTCKTDNGEHASSVVACTSVHSSLLRSPVLPLVSVDAAAAAEGDMMESSVNVSDHLIKSGIAAIGFLSDLLSYKLPLLDGNGVFSSSQIFMAESTKPVTNTRSSITRHHKRGSFVEVQRKPLVDAAGSSLSSTPDYHGRSDKLEKPGSRKVSGHVQSNSVKTVETYQCHTALGTRSQKHDNSQRSKLNAHATSSASKTNGWNQEAKITQVCSTGIRSEGNDQKPAKSFRVRKETAPLGKQFVNSEHVVDRVFHVLQRMKWGPMAEKTLKNLNCSLDAYQANQILKQLQDHFVALGFFYWLKLQAGFKHDEHTYTTMVGILGRAKQFDTINRFLDEMVRDGCVPNVVTYNRLIHSYGRANYVNEAMKVYYQMQEAGCTPDRVTYCTLIDIHAKAGFLDVALDMYRRMQEVGLSPDTFTYSVIINCLGKAGHVAAAYKLFCEMIAQGCVPNLVTYNIMIALQSKARNYNSALKLYQDLQTAGFQPDKVTYNIVMEVLGHCGYLEKAEAVFSEMKNKNWVPDEPVYGLLVDLWGKAGNVDKARSWYQSMLNDGLCPNVPTCNSLLSAFLRLHRFSDSLDVLQSMLNLGLKPTLQTYTLLLSSCTDARSHVDMSHCRELMEISGHPTHEFLLTMPAAGPDGQNVRDHASHFLNLMHSEDRESKRGLLDAVIDFLHKSGLKEEASSVWEVAALRNIYPDVLREKSPCYWLINLHVMSDGTAVIALSRTLAWFRRRIIASGIRLRRIDIVTGWGRRSRVTGSSLVRQSVWEFLNVFGFPFFTENGNSGCFVGCGDRLNRWLLQPYVERMHLL